MTRAVVLLSGGLDSSTVLYVARRDGHDPIALTVDYGQRHRREIEAARALAGRAGVEHVVMPLDLRPIGGSALTSAIEVPKDRGLHEISSGIPVTYVPARNTILLSLALGLAEARGALDLYVGVNAVDYSGYPDCRPEFVAAFETLAQLATKAGVGGDRYRIRAPLQELSKAEIVRLAYALGVPMELTFSCYDPTPEARACGRCDSCTLRRKGFAEAGLTDPSMP